MSATDEIIVPPKNARPRYAYAFWDTSIRHRLLPEKTAYMTPPMKVYAVASGWPERMRRPHAMLPHAAARRAGLRQILCIARNKRGERTRALSSNRRRHAMVLPPNP